MNYGTDRYVVERTIEEDPDGAGRNAEEVRGELRIVQVHARVHNLITGKVGEDSLSGIVISNAAEDETYALACLAECVENAKDEAGIPRIPTAEERRRVLAPRRGSVADA